MDLELAPWQDDSDWDELVQNSAEGSVFCTRGFLEALDCPYQLLQLTQDQTIVAGIPLLFDADGSTPHNAPHPFTMYQGPLFSGEIAARTNHSRVSKQNQLLEFLIEELASRYDKISFCLHHALQDIRQFQWFHYNEPPSQRFSIAVRYTGRLYLDDYEDFDDYLKNIRAVRRREYKQADKNQLNVESVGAEAIDDFVQLYIDTFTRQGLDLPERQVYLCRRLCEYALRDKCGELLFAHGPTGQLLSGTLFIHDCDTSYYMLSATDMEQRHLAANTLLLIENIRRSQEQGKRYIDFVGVNSPGRGDFKLGFDAVPTPYFIVQWPGSV